MEAEPMSATKTRNLAWLDRMAMSVPGYGGYSTKTERQAAAFALRDAINRHLEHLAKELEHARIRCREQEAVTEIHAVERLEQHLARVIARVEGLGTRYEHFYSAPDLDRSRVDPLHQIDLALVAQAERLAHQFEQPDNAHDRLADIERELTELEVMLDGRALMIQGVNPA
jgi:hypothetical protein